MTSSLINFIINNFLSNFLEINPNQTYISFLSGELFLQDVKIKKTSLEYINIDYLELINGYIGSIKILLKIPDFYSNPIKIYINDLFIYAKQKKIENINEIERIKNLNKNKSYRLSIEEQLNQGIEEVHNEDGNFVSQIINNLNIFINNIVIRFEDDSSNPKIPFSIGLITKSLKIISFTELYDPNFNINEQNNISRKSSNNNIINMNNVFFSDNINEISDKKIILDRLYFYMDCFNKKDDLNYDNYIEQDIKLKFLENFDIYINDISKFYYYCKSELDIHRNNKDSHEYIFYKLNLDINFSINFNLENNNPLYQIEFNDIDNFDIYLTVKQISLFFNLLSYYNLYYLYQLGLNKSIFNLNLNQTEKKKYVLDYLEYYYNNIILKNKNYNLSNFIKEKEEKMAYEYIKILRKVAIKNIKLYEKIKEIEQKLEKSKNTWFLKYNKNEINALESKLHKLRTELNQKIIKMNKQSKGNLSDNPDNKSFHEEYNNTSFNDLSDNQNENNQNILYNNLPDNFILNLIKMNIKNSHIIIFDDEYESKNKYKTILDINLTNFFFKITICIKMFNLYFNLSNMKITQGIAKSKEYDIILMTKPNKEDESINNKKLLIFEFEINQNENFTYKILIKNEKKIIFILNLFELQYIQYKILGSIFTSISFMDLSNYAKGNINKYLRIGYLINEEKYKKNISRNGYYNYLFDINILSPLIIIPQNILDIYNNKCIIVNFGDISLNTCLVSSTIRHFILDVSNNTEGLENSNLEDKSFSSDSNNSDDLYDIYNLSIKGFNVLVSHECLKKDYYISKFSSSTINKTDISIIYKTLINPQDKKLNNSYLNINIDKLELNLDEFQILLLIVLSKQIKTQNLMLYQMQQKKEMKTNNSILYRSSTKVIKNFKESLIDTGILKSEENENEKNQNNKLKKDIVNSYSKEEDFLNKKNSYIYAININKIKLTIFKKYSDLSRQTFLESEIDLFEFKMYGNLINDSLMKIAMRNLKLFDKEKNINKQFIVLKEYQTLIKENQIIKNNNDNMFSYSNIYIDNLKENKIEIKFSNIDIIITFDSLTRIYTFSMYYYKMFYENYLNAFTSTNLQINKEKQNILLEEDKTNNNKLSSSQTLIAFNNKIPINKNSKKEVIKNKFIFQIKIINNNILIPYNPSSLDCPILSFKLNIFYDQSSDSETIKIYDKNKKLIQTIIKPNNSYLNLMIYESDFDIVKYNYEKKLFILQEKLNKIISKYRIQFTYKFSNVEINNQSLSDINILIEPIIVDINLEQFKEILIFYNQLMKFLYENLYEYYIPYIKPENVIYHKGKEFINKKKMTFKNLAQRVFALIKIRNSFNKKGKKNKKKEDIFNSINSININMDKATITIFDNELNQKRLLLEIKLTKMIFKSINNAKPKNKNNVMNELLGIITGTTVPFQNYIIHNLYRYMDISFIFEFNYYNLEYSSFEPIIEPLPFQYLSYQVDKIFRYKTIMKSDNILNFNISSNCIKVLNLFLCKYYSEKKIFKEKNDLVKLKEKNLNNNSLEKNDKIILNFINKTGMPVRFWFDFKDKEKYILNNKEYLNFSNKTLFKSRRQQIKIQQKNTEINSFSFQILGYEVIPNINLTKNNFLYFKTKVADNKYLYYNVTVDTSGFINKIKFDSSIIFHNKTIFNDLLLSIDDNSIKDNYIKLYKDKKIRIPLSWMLSDKNIYFQLSKKHEKHIIYKNIRDCIFCKKLNEEELEKSKNEKIKIKENLTNLLNNSKEINLQHPKYKEYISSYIGQKFNKKNDDNIIKIFTVIDEKQNNKTYSFNLNYLALSYNEKNNNHNSKIYNKLENSEKSYKYIILIRPIISITNSIPFNINCEIISNKTNQNEKKQKKNIITINSLKTKEIYDINWIINKNLLYKVGLNYDDNIFYSNNFPLMEDTSENLLKKVILRDKNSNILISNILVKKVDEESDSIIEIVEQFSISSIHFIIFFDYIINNRLEFNIYVKEKFLYNYINAKDNSISIFKKKKLSLFSSIKDIHKIKISASKKEFDKKNKFFVKSIGLNKNFEILNDKKIFNISCITLNSIDFIYSNIIIFEPKYILINNLDCDMFYYQITNEKNKSIEIIKKNGRNILFYEQKTDKILFKIGMRIGSKFSWSGPFNINDSKDYDYKIEINKDTMKKYKKFSYFSGIKNYLYFRIKFKIFQNTIYIFLIFPEFPYLEIKNRTSEKIKIFEDEQSTPIIIEPRKDVPFIWEDVTKIKEKLICQIQGVNHFFSYSSFDENKIKFNKNKYISIAVRRNKTSSRYLILEEKGYKTKFRDIFMKKQLKLLSEMIIDLKGIGLSFLDETPKEIFFISFYGIKLIYKKTMLLKNLENIECFNFYLKNFQIDYCLNDSLKSLIYPKIQKIPSLEEQNNAQSIDFIMAFIERISYNDLKNQLLYVNYNKIAFFIQEMNVKINQIILMNLINLIQIYTSLLDYSQKITKNKDIYIKEDNLIENHDKYIENLIKENFDSNKTLINYLILSAFKINLTLRIDLSNIEISFLPDIISNTIISLGSSLIRITESPLSFSQKVIQDIYMDTNLIISLLIKEFTADGIFQIYKILGSTDLIGNPVNLIDKIGNGFFEFVNEPTKGLMKGPSQFGKGLAKGVTGLLNGVVGGTMDSVSKITGTLYSTVHGILGKKELLLIDEEEDEPENLLIGATKGIEGGYQELKEGVTGFFINPFEKAKKAGAIGFIEGLSTGIFGLAISPFTFALKLGGSLAIGTKNTFGILYNKSLKNKRFRFPRYIEELKPLKIYDADLSAAKEFLSKLIGIENPVILYFTSFICNNDGYEEKMAFLIVTNELFLILSYKNEILLNISIKELKDIKFLYENESFMLTFEMKDKNKKTLIIDKSCAVMACHFYDIIKDEINLYI